MIRIFIIILISFIVIIPYFPDEYTPPRIQKMGGVLLCIFFKSIGNYITSNALSLNIQI